MSTVVGQFQKFILDISDYSMYRIMTYTSAGHNGTTHRRSLYKSQEKRNLIISKEIDAVVKDDFHGNNGLE